MTDRPALPAWGDVPEGRASYPQACRASDSASAYGRHLKPLQEHARAYKGPVSRQPSAESDDRASTGYQIIAGHDDTSGENSGFSGSSGDEAAPRGSPAPGLAPSSSRRGKRAGSVGEAGESSRNGPSGFPRSSSACDVSRVLRPAVSAGVEGSSSSSRGNGSRVERSAEEEQPSPLQLRRAQTHALHSVFDAATSGHASDCDSSNHSEREERRWLDESRLRLDGIGSEAASLPNSSPLADMGVRQAASGEEPPAQEAHGTGMEGRKKAGFFKGALQAMKRVGRTSKGGGELEEYLHGAEHAEESHSHGFERRGSMPVGGSVAVGPVSPSAGGNLFGRQSSVGAELGGAARRVAARATRRRNQSVDVDAQSPDTVGLLAPQETHRRPRVQRVWTCPDGDYGSSPLMSVPEGGSSAGAFQKKRGAAAGHYDSLASLASRPAIEISVVSSAMPAMRTAVPPAVVHQIAARSEPVVACQVSMDAACPTTPSTLGLCSPRLSARGSSGAVHPQAAAQAQAMSPFTPITLPETALPVASPGASSDALFLTSSHPATLMPREARGMTFGTPVKAVTVTPMKVAPATPEGAGGSAARGLTGSRGEGSGAGGKAAVRGQRRGWKVVAEEVQDVMIGILVLVSLCSLFLGKISALVATLAVALLASRTMPPRSGVGARQHRHAGSPHSSPAKARREVQGVASEQSPLLLPADSGAFGGTPKTESVRQQQIQNILQYSRTTDPKARHVLEGLLSRPTKTKARR